jgi:hypothetical protein
MEQVISLAALLYRSQFLDFVQIWISSKLMEYISKNKWLEVRRTFAMEPQGREFDTVYDWLFPFANSFFDGKTWTTFLAITESIYS